jgi:uncharacterized protein (DUF4415 family)
MSNESTLPTSQTDWVRVDAMRDEEIDFSDCPEITPEMVTKAVVRKGLQPVPAQVQVTLCLDRDVLAWFKAQGEGYQACINAALRAYKEARGKA